MCEMPLTEAARKNLGFLIALGSLFILFFSIVYFPDLKDLVGPMIGGVVGLYAVHEGQRWGEHFNASKFTPNNSKGPVI